MAPSGHDRRRINRKDAGVARAEGEEEEEEETGEMKIDGSRSWNNPRNDSQGL
jgi:hypothetical protein